MSRRIYGAKGGFTGSILPGIWRLPTLNPTVITRCSRLNPTLALEIMSLNFRRLIREKVHRSDVAPNGIWWAEHASLLTTPFTRFRSWLYGMPLLISHLHD